MRWMLMPALLMVATSAHAQKVWRAEPLPFTAFDDDAPSPPTDARDVAVLKNGSVAVLDFGRQEVRIFTADGKPVRTIGRRGKGPGEFDQANGIVATADGGLVVYDPTNARLTVFDAAGAFVRVVPVRIYSFGYRWGVVLMADGQVGEISIMGPI